MNTARSTPRVLVVLTVAALLFTPGCNCVRTPHSMKLEKNGVQESLSRPLDKVAPTPASSAGASSGGDPTSPFTVTNRMVRLREAAERSDWDDVKSEGMSLVNAGLDDITRLEVCFLVAEACHRTGDRDRARDFADQGRKLHRDLLESDLVKGARTDRAHWESILSRFKGKLLEDRFADQDGEARSSFDLAHKISTAPADGVVDHVLPDGAQVWASKSSDALMKHLVGVAPGLEASIGRDPEFGYYFAIKETVTPPATSNTRGR